MPTYEYVCEACGHQFEHFQSMTSRRLRTCPECRKKALVRLVGTGAGLIFKGSGFYETDYKRAGEKKPAETSKPKGSEKKEGGKDASSTGASAETSSSDG